MDNLILVDGNSIGYAAHSARELNHNGQQVQAIFFSLKMIRNAFEYANTKGQFPNICVLWDSRAKWRYDLYPEYKGKRDDNPEKRESRAQYKQQQPHIRRGLSLLGIPQAFAKGEEADDLAAAIVHNRAPGQKILLVSGDQDWLQLVTDNVDWYDPREEGRHVSKATFQQFTGFKNPVGFIQAKAIKGDSSDNIKGVEGLGDKAIASVFEEYGSAVKFFGWADAYMAGSTGPFNQFEKGALPASLSRFRSKLERFVWGEGMAEFKRNMQLMNLMSPRHRSTEIIDKQVLLAPSYNETGFVDFCHEFAFLSLVKSAHTWKTTFCKEAA